MREIKAVPITRENFAPFGQFYTMDHLGNCQEWDLRLGDGVRFLPPYATGHTGAYRGKLEALQTALPVLERSEADYVVLADTTVLCAIDFNIVLEEHIHSGCDVTVVAKAGKADGVKHCQLALKLGEDGKICDMRILFDSKLSQFKSPFGTLSPAQVCTLRVRIPCSCRTTGCELILQNDQGEEDRRVPLALEDSDELYGTWVCRFSLPAPGLFFYYFFITTEEGAFPLYKQGDDTNMEAEYRSGNYVVCAGDFNKDLLGDSSAYFGVSTAGYTWAQSLRFDLFDGTDLSVVAPLDPDNPVPSCRNADAPYHEGQLVLTVDGFVVSPNVTVSAAEVLDEDFRCSDHNPVRLTFTLNDR